MDIKEFIANKKVEINNEWEGSQKDEWTNGYYNALSDIEKALSQHDVIKSVCDRCLKEKELKVCNECYCSSMFE